MKREELEEKIEDELMKFDLSKKLGTASTNIISLIDEHTTQMDERIKELKKELLCTSIVRNTLKDKLKESQQENQRLREGIKELQETYTSKDGNITGKMWNEFEQFLQTKQNKEV